MTIGPMKMHGVVVHLGNVVGFENWHTESEGVIGYDLLANAVVSMDYVSHALKAFVPTFFVPPADSVPTPVNIDSVP